MRLHFEVDTSYVCHCARGMCVCVRAFGGDCCVCNVARFLLRTISKWKRWFVHDHDQKIHFCNFQQTLLKSMVRALRAMPIAPMSKCCWVLRLSLCHFYFGWMVCPSQIVVLVFLCSREAMPVFVCFVLRVSPVLPTHSTQCVLCVSFRTSENN